MWSRESIKNYAKDFLRKHYWKAFLVCLIASLLSGSSGSNSSNSSRRNNDNYYYNEYNTMDEFDDMETFELDNPAFNFITKRIPRSPLFFITGGVFWIMAIIFVIVLVTIGYAIEVGKNRFFLRGFEGDVSIGKLFSTFNSMEYWGIIKTQFLRGLYNLLWTLLFIIPGIIKSYEYKFVPYILSEEPNLSSNEVITRSREMTDGHKMDMFVLDLSFLGWYILGGLLFGIGVFFVNPYVEATYARLYNVLSGNDDIDYNDHSDYDIIVE